MLNSSVGLVMGSLNKESDSFIVHHYMMSAERTIKVLARLFRDMRTMDTDPFGNIQGQVSVYDCLLFGKKLRQLIGEIDKKSVRQFPQTEFSSYCLLDEIGSTDYEKEDLLLQALDDCRDTSFIKNHHIGPLFDYTAEANLAHYVQESNFYVTPNLLQHFDFSGVTCVDALFHRNNFMAIQLGFRTISQKTGNAE